MVQLLYAREAVRITTNFYSQARLPTKPMSILVQLRILMQGYGTVDHYADYTCYDNCFGCFLLDNLTNAWATYATTCTCTNYCHNYLMSTRREQWQKWIQIYTYILISHIRHLGAKTMVDTNDSTTYAFSAIQYKFRLLSISFRLSITCCSWILTTRRQIRLLRL